MCESSPVVNVTLCVKIFPWVWSDRYQLSSGPLQIWVSSLLEVNLCTLGSGRFWIGFKTSRRPLLICLTLMLSYITLVCDITADSCHCVYKVPWSLSVQHLKCRLNEQSHSELRHKIQCERCFSTRGSVTRMRTKQETTWRDLGGCWHCVLKSKALFRKVLTDKVNLNVVDPDAAAAEKHRLRIIIIIIVIIIILWYNKDIQLPIQAKWGVQWFAVAMVQWSPLGLAVGSTRVSVNQPSVRSLQGWEGLCG